jgi:hypothetical protein
MRLAQMASITVGIIILTEFIARHLENDSLGAGARELISCTCWQGLLLPLFRSVAWPMPSRSSVGARVDPLTIMLSHRTTAHQLVAHHLQAHQLIER